MGKLYYFYGTMNSAKSANLLTKAFQFKESNCEVIMLKPSFDTRDKGVIKSRAITTPQSCHVFDKNKDVFQLVYSLLGQVMANKRKIGKVVVFVDEVNFITKEQVEQLWRLTRTPYDISVFAYGLKTTYQNTLFEASEQLLVLSDSITEIKSMCCKCNNKATTHLRKIKDKYVFDGDECIVGDINGQDETYESVCETCWYIEYDKESNENGSID